jgi:hypothetical protein
MSQLTTRDYKGAGRREGAPSGGLKEFLFGALAGALLASIGTALVMHHAYRSRRACAACAVAPSVSAPPATTPASVHSAPPPPGSTPQTTAATPSVAASEVSQPTARRARVRSATPRQSAAAQPQYDFYQMLPNLKVIVPRPSAAGAHATGVHGPGAYGGYILQVGSYSNAAQAEHIMSELDSVGIIAQSSAIERKSSPRERSLRYRCVRSIPTRLASCPTLPLHSSSCCCR